MKNLIKKLFEKSIELGDVKYSEKEVNTNWIGNPPTSKGRIKVVEQKLEVAFPDDYKELVLIANGFKTSTYSVEPSFLPIEEVEYFRKLYPDVPEMFRGGNKEFDEIGINLEKSIVIAGVNEEQQFLIIPPEDKNANWKYWKFANWIPGEEEYEDLKEYLKSVIEFLEETIKEEK